ncbi:MAG TPA: hypothetical protein EYN67_13035 [Flavobacteriales bacterium]|nr:hypothetical protein [Flavobacteriales bacterium]
MSNKLSDPNFLFSILTAIVKQSGGKIVLTKDEYENISKGDFLGMYYEPKTDNLILKEVEPEDMLQASAIIRDKKATDKVYDN